MNKFNIIEVVNRKFTHPRNIISAFTDKLMHQRGFGGPGIASGDDIGPDFDPSQDGGSEDLEFSVPPEPLTNVDGDWSVDSIETGTIVEEELTVNGASYMTSLPFEFFRAVWYDGLLANYSEHFTLSGSFELIPNTQLLSGTEVIGQYVVGFE